jgi:hypothetical protein
MTEEQKDQKSCRVKLNSTVLLHPYLLLNSLSTARRCLFFAMFGCAVAKKHQTKLASALLVSGVIRINSRYPSIFVTQMTSPAAGRSFDFANGDAGCIFVSLLMILSNAFSSSCFSPRSQRVAHIAQRAPEHQRGLMDARPIPVSNMQMVMISLMAEQVASSGLIRICLQ